MAERSDADRTHGGVEAKAGSSAVNAVAAAKRRAIVLGDARKAVVRRVAGVHAGSWLSDSVDEAKLGVDDDRPKVGGQAETRGKRTWFT